ncbi:MAG: TadE/TadG family type IV pilus assembly protein [Planctomycetota bacterium]
MEKQQRQGAVTVEFALTAGIAFATFFAAFEFCRVAMIRHTTDNAVYEACRVGIVPGATRADVEARAQTVLGTIGLGSTSITITPAVIDADTTDITVSIDVPIDGNSFVPPQFTGGNTISRTLTMQRERVGS